MSRVIKAGQSIPAPPVFVGRRFDPAEEPASLNSSPAPAKGKEEPPAGRNDGTEALSLDTAAEKAKQIIEAAQSYSARVIQEAGEQIARETASVRKRAYAEGYAQGMEKGKADGIEAGRRSGEDEGRRSCVAENRKHVQELGRMIEAVEKSKTQILEQFEGDLQNLAVAIARAVLHREIETDDRTMRSIILNAMDSYRNQGWVRIYVSGETAGALMKADNNIIKALQDVSDNVKVVPTDGMNEGSCVIEMPDQVIDAGVDSQLRKIRTSIEDAMRVKAQ